MSTGKNETIHKLVALLTVSCSPAVVVIVLPSGVGALGSDGGATVINNDGL